MSIGHFVIELLAEILAGILFGAIIWFKHVRDRAKLQAIKDEYKLNTLNNNVIDQVLLIDKLEDLSNQDYQQAYEDASIVLMKQPRSGLYNVVVKNKYGSDGVIK